MLNKVEYGIKNILVSLSKIGSMVHLSNIDWWLLVHLDFVAEEAGSCP